MKVLLIDTSQTNCSLNLIDTKLKNDKAIICKTAFPTKTNAKGKQRRAAEEICTCIKDTIDKIEIDTIGRICSLVGPGSFTGIRTGIAAAKALSFAWQKPCLGVNNLFALALTNFTTGTTCLPLISCRNERAYYANFTTPPKNLYLENNRSNTCPAPKVDHYQKLVNNINHPTIICGNGTTEFMHYLNDKKDLVIIGSQTYNPVILARFVAKAQAQALPALPVYVSPPNAKAPVYNNKLPNNINVN